MNNWQDPYHIDIIFYILYTRPYNILAEYQL